MSGVRCGPGGSVRANAGEWDIRPPRTGPDGTVLALLGAVYSRLSWAGTRGPADTLLGTAVAEAAAILPEAASGSISQEGARSPEPPVVLAAYSLRGALAGIIAANWDRKASSAGDARSALAFVPWSPVVDPELDAERREQVALALIRGVLNRDDLCGRATGDGAVPVESARYVMRFTSADEAEVHRMIAWYRRAGFVSPCERVIMSRPLDQQPDFADPPAEPCDWCFVPIDPTSAGDFGLAASLLQAAFAEGDDPDAQKMARSPEACARWLAAALAGERGGAYAHGLWLVARDASGAAMGFAFLLERGPTALHLADLGVLPEYRRRGLGGRLLREALRLGRRRGKSEITLVVVAPNQTALRLYARLGFRKVTSLCAMEWARGQSGEL